MIETVLGYAFGWSILHWEAVFIALLILGAVAVVWIAGIVMVAAINRARRAFARMAGLLADGADERLVDRMPAECYTTGDLTGVR